MSILSIVAMLILGIFMIDLGLKTKRKWLVAIAIILILLVMSQVIILFSMMFH